MIFPDFSDSPRTNTTLRINAAGILIHKDTLLLECRSDCGQWGLIGGRIEVGEDPLEAFIREAYEETALSLDPQNVSLFNVYGDPKDFRIVDYPDASVHIIDIVYVCRISSVSNLSLSSESLEIRGFLPGELDSINLIPPAHRPICDFIEMNGDRLVND